jgi:hypothetical protein
MVLPEMVENMTKPGFLDGNNVSSGGVEDGVGNGLNQVIITIFRL